MEPEQLYLDPRTLRPNPWNTNIVPPENEAKLDEAIRRLGMFKPVVVRQLADGSYEILGGEHRSASSIRVGLESIPVMNLGRIDDKLAKEISLADNSRYGTDDVLSLAGLLEELGTADDLASFLPYTDVDLKSIFASSDIALDDLEFEEKDDDELDVSEPKLPKAPKTHTIMRFKVPVGDAQRISELVTQTQRDHDLTGSDELTNAGDALVHLLLNAGADA